VTQSSMFDGEHVSERVVDRFYEESGSLFVEAYDAFYSASAPQIIGDVAFYERAAREVGGPVLELACGTGRVALPLAKAGLQVTGVDRSEAMLTIARRKLAALPASVRERLSLVNQDMSALNLDRDFGLILVPFRSFQSLLTIDLQRRSLEAIRPHMAPTGRLILHLFDPRLDWLIDPKAIRPKLSGTHPETGRRYVGEFCEPISATSTKFAAISGATPKSGSMVSYWLRTLARWRCAGPIAGSCIICSTSAASQSRQSTAISPDRPRPMEKNWSSSLNLGNVRPQYGTVDRGSDRRELKGGPASARPLLVDGAPDALWGGGHWDVGDAERR
jgi:SAM-dependent methyltransferase